MTEPLVTVITPTWQRHGLLTGRCLPSVQSQTYPRIEHLIVSDGPDDGCRAAVNAWWQANAATNLDSQPPGSSRRLRYTELEQHDLNGQHWGHLARLRGLDEAAGDIIAYLDDDDCYRPEHLAVLVPVLLGGKDFAYSQMVSHMTGEILYGGPVPMPGNIGTPMLVHWKRLTETASWGPADAMEDWHLVSRWVGAGLSWEFVPVPTVDVWPSVWHHH